MIGDDEDSGFAEICAVLSERFGTRFELQNTGGDCVTLMAHLFSSKDFQDPIEEVVIHNTVQPR